MSKETEVKMFDDIKVIMTEEEPKAVVSSEFTIDPLKYSKPLMSKEIDFMCIEDGDVIGIEAKANQHDGEKYIALDLSHKCNDGSVILWLSELKKLVEILDGDNESFKEKVNNYTAEKLGSELAKNAILESENKMLKAIIKGTGKC